MQRKHLVAGLFLMLAGATSGCSISLAPLNASVQLKAQSKFELAVKGQEIREIVVDSHHGSIDIAVGEGPDVQITAELRAAEEADLKNILVEATSQGGVAKIDWTTADGSFQNREVHLDIKAPAGMVLQLKTGAGSISALGFKNGLVARTEAGAIKSQDVSGDLDLKTSAGEISVKNALGKVLTETSAGSLKIDGTLKGECKAITGAGSVDVRLAESNQLKIIANTDAGTIRNGFGWTAKGNVNVSLAGSVGDGSQGSLTIRTGAGGIAIDRAQ